MLQVVAANEEAWRHWFSSMFAYQWNIPNVVNPHNVNEFLSWPEHLAAVFWYYKHLTEGILMYGWGYNARENTDYTPLSSAINMIMSWVRERWLPFVIDQCGAASPDSMDMLHRAYKAQYPDCVLPEDENIPIQDYMWEIILKYWWHYLVAIAPLCITYIIEWWYSFEQLYLLSLTQAIQLGKRDFKKWTIHIEKVPDVYRSWGKMIGSRKWLYEVYHQMSWGLEYPMDR